MIDSRTETLLTLTQAARQLPSRTHGKSLHKSVLYRWAQKGLRGVRLETIPIGGTRFTSEEALQRFFENLATAERCDTPSVCPNAQRAIEECRRDGF